MNKPQPTEVLRAIASLIGGWREAISELEDWCGDPVRPKNMMAALDQVDKCRRDIRDCLEGRPDSEC